MVRLRRTFYRMVLVFSLHIVYSWVEIKHQKALKIWLNTQYTDSPNIEQARAKIASRHGVVSLYLKSELEQLGVSLE